MYISENLTVEETKKGKSLSSVKDIKRGEVLIKFDGKISDKPTKLSLQIDENKHLQSADNIDDYLNHSCEPNGYIDFNDLSLRALRDIRKGEEITFNYLTTEWDMANKFECKCGSKNCIHYIKGFKYLTQDQQKKLEPLLSPFLKKMLKRNVRGSFVR